MDSWMEDGQTDGQVEGGWMEAVILLRSLGFLDCLTHKSALYSLCSEVEKFPKALKEGMTQAERYCRPSDQNEVRLSSEGHLPGPQLK